MSLSPREHPPTAAAAAAAVIASFGADVEPYLADLPVIGEQTAGLAVVLLVGLVGGAVGNLAERWTMPWFPPPEGDGPDDEGPEL